MWAQCCHRIGDYSMENVFVNVNVSGNQILGYG